MAGRGGRGSAQSKPNIIDCTFTYNSAIDGFYGDGGAIYDDMHSDITIFGCTFIDNSATDVGGGIANSNGLVHTSNSIFDGNFASNAGGAIYEQAGTMDDTISNCTFCGNSAHNGGGICQSGEPVVIEDCDFIRDFASGMGGGIYSSESPLSVLDCGFEGNSALDGGGIFHDVLDSFSALLTCTNCVFSGNLASWGGGIANQQIWDNSNHTQSPESLLLINCTISGDVASDSGGGVYSSSLTSETLSNCVVWGNVAPNYADITLGDISLGGSTLVDHDDIEYFGDPDPQFIRNPNPGPDGIWGTSDDDYGDLHLQFTSPAIDAGSNAAVPTGVTTDLDGSPRFFDFPGANNGAGAVVDMGAYELGYNLDEIIVPAGQTLALPTGGYPFSANSLSIGTGGTLDIADDSLTINYGTNSDPASTIASLIDTGYANGTWTGTGIISSAAFAQSSNTTGIGYFDNGSSITIRRTWYGDANLDGVINADDLSLMLLGQSQHTTRWQDGNFNYDTQVNADDWIQFMYVNAYAHQQMLPAVVPAFAQSELASAKNLNSLLDFVGAD